MRRENPMAKIDSTPIPVYKYESSSEDIQFTQAVFMTSLAHSDSCTTAADLPVGRPCAGNNPPIVSSVAPPVRIATAGAPPPPAVVHG